MRAHGAAEPQELEDHIRLCFVLSCGEIDHLVDERRRHESLREVLRLLPVDVLELCNLCRAAMEVISSPPHCGTLRTLHARQG